MILVSLGLAGCAALLPPVPTATPLPPPTLEPSATAIAELQGSPTPSPLTELTPAVVLEPPFLVPTATLPVVTAPLPFEDISLILPGPGSQVTSPFSIIGRGGPSWNQRVHIRLLGEDGAALASATAYIFALPENTGRFTSALGFAIPGVAEAARLEVVTDDLRSGRMAHLASVDLTLLSIGAPLIQPGSEGPEKLALFAPRENARVTGGRVTVRGAGWVDSDVPLRLEVIDRQGEIVGAAEVVLASPAVGQLGTFEVTIAYAIPSAQYGRIAVWEPGGTIPGIVHYTSIEVYLEP